MYCARLAIGSSGEGSSEPMAYYFIESEDRSTHPPLLVTTRLADDGFVSVADAATELAFLRRLGIRRDIAATLESLIAPLPR